MHHSALDSCYDQASCSQEVRDIQDLHMDENGWDDIGYSFLIGGDGQVYEGRGWNVQGRHTLNWNDLGYGIDFMGLFTDVLPEQVAMDVYHQLSAVNIVYMNVESPLMAIVHHTVCLKFGQNFFCL